MAELLEIYDLGGALLGTQERQEFYAEIKKEYAVTGKISRKVKSIRALIMNPEGRIYLQKRSNAKVENTGFYDKTIGGHVAKGESPELTVVRECAEELGFPAVVLSSADFDLAVDSTDLGVIGILRAVKMDPDFISSRTTTQGDFRQPHISHFYIGYYDGALKFKDGESSGLETFSLAELQEELTKNPGKFTEDLHVMVQEFSGQLVKVGQIPH